MAKDRMVTARLESRLVKKLDRLARAYDRSRSKLIATALAEFLERELAFVAAVEEGRRAADAGKLRDFDEVMAELATTSRALRKAA